MNTEEAVPRDASLETSSPLKKRAATCGLSPHYLSVTKMFLKQGLVLGLAGAAVGRLIGFFACRAITSGTFFNFGHVSVLPFAAVSLLLILTTIGASYLPARRASRIDPLQALREE
jgi:ABC-type antimicrobial peptide transport system permease subunit